METKTYIVSALAIVGAVVTEALGGWDASVQVLIALMVADYVTGVLLALLWQTSPNSTSGGLSSAAGFQGICKKCMVVFMVYLGVMLDQAVGANYIRTAIVLFFIGNEGLSLLENMGMMGVPFPEFLIRALEAMQEQGNQGSEEG